MIDLYCERVSPGLLAEPLNLFSNGFFLLAAYLALRQCRADNTLSLEVNWLLLLLTAIGLGSAAFHSLANRIGLLLDTIPIFLFQLSFLLLYARSVLRFSWLQVTLAVTAFLGLSALFAQSPIQFNGSVDYFSSLLMLLVLAGFACRQAVTGYGQMFLAAAVFVLSLTFRSVDNALCNTFAFGTHFLWHTLNSLMLYLLIVHFARARQRAN